MRDFASDIVNPGARRGLLFLHGFLGDREEFRHIGRDFEKSHTVVYVDLPGHGKNRIDSVIPDSFRDPDHQRSCPGSRNDSGMTNKSEMTFESIVSQLARLMQSQSPRQWHVVGYSLGGRLALYLACRWPHLIDRLTLISASPGLERERDRRLRRYSDRLLGQKIARCSMRAFLSYWYRQPLFSQLRTHPCFQAMLQRRLKNDPRQIQSALLAMSTGSQPSLWSELSSLRMPVELICGAHDEKFLRIARAMVQRNAQMQLRVVAHAGHVVHWEAPKVVIGRIANVENRMENCQSIQ